jgi:hypothetical protein
MDDYFQDLKREKGKNSKTSLTNTNNNESEKVSFTCSTVSERVIADKIFSNSNWKFEDSIVRFDLVNISCEHQFQSKIPIGKFIKKGLELVTVKYNDTEVKIRSPIFGRLLKLDFDEVVIEKCQHHTSYGGLCVDCHEKTSNTNSYLSMSKNVAFSDVKAKQLESIKIEKTLKEKKLILLLDLDNTILHSVDKRAYLASKKSSIEKKEKIETENFNSSDTNNEEESKKDDNKTEEILSSNKNILDKEKQSTEIDILELNDKKSKVVVNFRPGLKKFLK